MKLAEAFNWVTKNDRRANVVRAIKQPLTSTQCAKRIGLNKKICGIIMEELASLGILQRLNPQCWCGRVYWLTRLGLFCQKHLLKKQGKKPHKFDFPGVNWETYSLTVYSHRAAILKILQRPMRPLEIRRKIRFENPKIRINTCNVRGVLRLFYSKGIVKKINVRKRVHPLYELTDQGRLFRDLLIQADMPF